MFVARNVFTDVQPRRGDIFVARNVFTNVQPHRGDIFVGRMQSAPTKRLIYPIGISPTF